MIDDPGFWLMVDKNGPTVRVELGPCWIWTGKREGGYGRLQRGGRRYLAHRYAWYLTHGRLPEPCGLHRCDNPSCVRPEHVFEGTKTDNNADKVAKGRQAHGAAIGDTVRGAKHPLAQLADADVLTIRERVAAREWTQKYAAQRFGVSQQTVNDIVRGRSWTHVGGPVTPSRLA